MHAEHSRLHTLGKLFDCSQLLEAAAASIKATDEELAALRALWQQAAAAEKKLGDWNQTVGQPVMRWRLLPAAMQHPSCTHLSTDLSFTRGCGPAGLPPRPRSCSPPWMLLRWRRAQRRW